MVLFGEGELQVMAASPDGYQKVASWMISEEYTWAAPVLLKNGILIKDQRHLTFWSFEYVHHSLKHLFVLGGPRIEIYSSFRGSPTRSGNFAWKIRGQRFRNSAKLSLI